MRILEEHATPGGAWRTIDVLGCSNVEAAVHLIENRASVHQALARLNIPLAPPTRRTGGVVAGVTISLALSRVLAYLGVSAKTLLRGDVGRAQTAVMGLTRAVREYRTPFLYPTRGASELTNGLLRLLAAQGVTPEYGVKILEATRIRRDECAVETTLGSLKARRIAIASRAHCPLRRNDRQLDLAIRTSELQCLALHIQGSAPQFEYIEFHGRSFLRRARNLTPMVHPSPAADHSIVSVQLRAPKLEARSSDAYRDAQAREVVTQLQRSGLLASSVRLIAAWSEHFSLQTIPDRRIRELAREEKDWLLPIRTTDFGEELASSLSRLQLTTS